MNHKHLIIVASLFSTVPAPLLTAQVSQTWGASSAVQQVNASASFEFQNAPTDLVYVEDGLRFTRFNLDYGNHGCFFAGCPSHIGFYPGFSGNYMYGVGPINISQPAYMQIYAPLNTKFTGLEFIVGTGFFQRTLDVVWSAYNAGTFVDGGTTSGNVGDVIGFASAVGFDELRFSDIGMSSTNAPAFDEVRAELAANTVVPEPTTLGLLTAGLTLLGALARGRKLQKKF
jgi:PEP-CTERM motif